MSRAITAIQITSIFQETVGPRNRDFVDPKLRRRSQNERAFAKFGGAKQATRLRSLYDLE